MPERLGLTRRPPAQDARSRDGQSTPRDRATLRLAAFIGGLVLALAAGFGLGRRSASAALPPRPVTNFAIAHDKPMHLIVVRRDLSGYQHLHPTMAADGTWQVGLTLPAPGTWRAYTDFAALTTAGPQVAVTLGVDLSVAGGYAATPIPAAARDSTWMVTQ